MKSYHYLQRYNNHKKWFKEYYSKMHTLFFRKSEHWGKETELRSIITTFPGENDIEFRKVRYDFRALDGIVFGINTSYEDKGKVIKIIKKKCHEHGVVDFKIYQAFYNRRENKMDKVELKSLLNQ